MAADVTTINILWLQQTTKTANIIFMRWSWSIVSSLVDNVINQRQASTYIHATGQHFYLGLIEMSLFFLADRCFQRLTFSHV